MRVRDWAKVCVIHLLWIAGISEEEIVDYEYQAYEL